MPCPTPFRFLLPSYTCPCCQQNQMRNILDKLCEIVDKDLTGCIPPARVLLHSMIVYVYFAMLMHNGTIPMVPYHPTTHPGSLQIIQLSEASMHQKMIFPAYQHLITYIAHCNSYLTTSVSIPITKHMLFKASPRCPDPFQPTPLSLSH